MGNALDCLKSADRQSGSTPSRKKRHRSARHIDYILSSTPQWLPPSPAFPLTRGRIPQNERSSGHTHPPASVAMSSGSDPKNPLASRAGPMEDNFSHTSGLNSENVPHPSPFQKYLENPLLSKPGAIDNHRPPVQPSVNPLTEQNAHLRDDVSSSGTANTFSPANPLPASHWSLYSEGECMYKKPKAARKLSFGTAPFDKETSYSDSSSQYSTRRNFSTGRSTVDVNYANVHELCVIGFTRAQAENVINYRVRQCRHFQDTSEVKVVPGIDENTWERVKSRLTLVPAGALGAIKKSRGKHTFSYKTPANGIEHPSFEGVKCGDSSRTIMVDLNSCNAHELCVAGLSLSQASAVIEYRFTKGCFQFKEEIKSVPGISEDAYARVQSMLFLGAPKRLKKSPSKSPLVHSPAAVPSVARIGGSPSQIPLSHSPKPGANSRRDHCDVVPGVSGHDSEPPLSEPASRFRIPGVAGSPDLGVKISPRLSVGRTSDKATLRIASWNLQMFNEEKVGRPGVLEVVCTTIVRHGFSIIAVQEIGDKKSLEKVCQELNYPSLPKVQSLGGNTRQWDCCVSEKYTGRMFRGMEYNGFLWNKSSGVQLDASAAIEATVFTRKPYVGMFRLKKAKFAVASVHLKAENWGGKDRQRVEDEVCNLPTIMQSIDRGYDIILLGDFNLPPTSDCFQPLLNSGFRNIFSDYDPTNISIASPQGSKCYDNIWVKLDARQVSYDEGQPHGVVRRNLSLPVRTGEKASMVSDHCPIWAMFVITGN